MLLWAGTTLFRLKKKIKAIVSTVFTSKIKQKGSCAVLLCVIQEVPQQNKSSNSFVLTKRATQVPP